MASSSSSRLASGGGRVGWFHLGHPVDFLSLPLFRCDDGKKVNMEVELSFVRSANEAIDTFFHAF